MGVYINRDCATEGFLGKAGYLVPEHEWPLLLRGPLGMEDCRIVVLVQNPSFSAALVIMHPMEMPMIFRDRRPKQLFILDENTLVQISAGFAEHLSYAMA